MKEFSFRCYGHTNITALHKSTLEFTTESDLTQKGDCIVGVKASTNLKSLPKNIQTLIRKNDTKIKVILKVNEFSDEIQGRGHPDLNLSDENAIIIRTSNYICPRTLMINANKAAKDILMEIRNLMKDSKTVMDVTLQLESG